MARERWLVYLPELLLPVAPGARLPEPDVPGEAPVVSPAGPLSELPMELPLPVLPEPMPVAPDWSAARLSQPATAVLRIAAASKILDMFDSEFI